MFSCTIKRRISQRSIFLMRLRLLYSFSPNTSYNSIKTVRRVEAVIEILQSKNLHGLT